MMRTTVSVEAIDALEKASVDIWAVLEHGESKHQRGEFTKYDAAHHIRAALGHLERYQDGHTHDEDSGEHNLAHVAARIILAMYVDKK